MGRDEGAELAGLGGRDQETAELAAALADLQAGQGGVVLLEGEGGVGKTTLGAWLVAEAQARGLGTVEAHAYPLLTNTPYAPLAAALGATLRADHAAAGDLTAGLSSLALLLDGLGDPPPFADPAVARTRLHDALASVCTRLARQTPLVLSVDDVHWADSASVEVLQLVAADLPDAPILLALTVRPFEADERPEVRALLAAVRRQPTTRTVEVSHLDRQAIAHLITERLEGLVPERLIDLVHRRSGGTPLVAEELLAELVDRGQLVRTGARWALAGDLDDTAPRVAHDLIGDRIDRLGPPERRLLELVAAAGEPIEDELLGRIDGTSAADRHGRLRTLVDLSLVDAVVDVDDRAAWRPHHPIVGEVVLDRLPEPERRSIHARFIEVLGPGADVTTLARHHLRAGPAADPEQAVRVLHQSGRRALARGAPVEATRELGAALDLLDAGHGTEHLAEVLEDLAEGWRRRGEPHLVTDHLLRALSVRVAAGDVVGEARIMANLDEARWMARAEPDEIDRAARLDDLIVRLDAAGHHRELVELHQYRSMDAVRAGDFAAARVHIGRLRAAASTAGDERSALFARLSSWLGPPADVWTLVEQWRTVLPADVAAVAGHPDLELRLHHVAIDLADCFGSTAEVQAALDAERAHLERAGDLPTWRVSTSRFNLAIAEGQLEGADEMAFEDYRVHTRRARCLSAFMRALHCDYRDDRTGAQAEVAMVRAELADPRPGDAVVALGVDAVDVRVSDPAEAAEAAARLLEETQDSWFMAGFPLLALTSRAMALVVLDRRAELDDLLGPADHVDLDSLGRWGAWVEVLRAHRTPDRRHQAQHLALAGDRFAAAGFRLDAARAHVDAARLDGGVVDDERLLAAAELLARVGARDRGPAANRLLADRGLHARSSPGDDLGITAREREVAEAVAEGLTNREVAERLFISVRTVTSHLDHVYTKLGISSRGELADLVGRTDA